MSYIKKINNIPVQKEVTTLFAKSILRSLRFEVSDAIIKLGSSIRMLYKNKNVFTCLYLQSLPQQASTISRFLYVRT